MSQHQSEQNFAVTNPAQPNEGEKAARTSLILGIIGLFVLGIVLGPLAIMQAKKAERLGSKATAGMVLGWIAAVLSVIWIIFYSTRMM
ncbi:DUF4190 domain-containing protein [Arthrobacter sp. MSA 4-2]|uniref:DUF4190 domain-containing protein n=1 Tax=Arthrobacter sp. MSA 4-2 TaxID=2794349 RepID=UPI0018E8DED3|nr:DUF4190 domain-containing protein [Arthrobacter sp. MSA 4-2]MBJ2120151.1 DUF4190 domain-containing protein [Arthrobacter sp. MSA 4-2]